MSTTERRRESRLAFEPASGVLVVGSRTALLDVDPEPDVVIDTYVQLVLSQRAVRPTSRLDLRDREIDELGAMLELPPALLDALIDRGLDRMLGRVAGRAAGEQPSPGVPTDGRAEHRRWALAAGAVAAVAVAVAAGVATASNALGSTPPPGPPITLEVDG